MQVQYSGSAIETLSVDAAALLCFEAEEKNGTTETVAADSPLAAQSGWLEELRRSGEFTGKLYDVAIRHQPAGLKAKRLLVVGGGKRPKFSSVEARRVAGVLVRMAKSKGIRTLALELPAGTQAAEWALAASEGAIVGHWEADRYKTDPKKNEKQVETFILAVADEGDGGVRDAVERGRVIGEAQNYARDLVNEPSNKLTPAKLAEMAQASAQEYGLGCEVLDQQAMEKLGMGALLGVAQGSSNPPFLIAIKYQPSKVFGSDHLAIVGKGVTFDTGGISIKPADGMEKMKYDMAGAAATIAAMRAIAQLKPTIPVTGYVPTVENMINGNAQRPGDIVTSLAGKTIEVLNTDAEGRLILADAITYATRNGATHLIDAATLTGAIGIALGHHNMGAFTNNQEYLGRFLRAAQTAGEKAWQLPMDEEYKDYLKSAFADLPNIGGRYGGSITAAWFLREFADPTPWIHLDIASTAWLDDGKAWMSKGPTGVAVRSFVQMVIDWA
jgi:leucyl aminopeptidase